MEAVESLKTCTLMACLVQSIYIFRWISTEKLCLMAIKSDPKKSKFLRNMHVLCDAVNGSYS